MEGISMEGTSKKGTLWDASLCMEERLDWLLGELTLEEKLHMLSSGSAGVERLGIPTCYLGGEAAHGVEARNDQNGVGTPDFTTSFPQPIGMSSSWDQEAIQAAGEIVGKEARIAYYRHPRGGISRWAPTVDLLRDPRWGRNEEAYGEDPVQVGGMAAAYVRGIQKKVDGHMMCAATLKHFYANNTEIGRGWKNVSMSPRNKYEFYMEPFRRCIEDGGVEGVMTAYNRINGVQGLFNTEVKNLLKKEFGLGHAVSDGGAMELSAMFSHATAMDAETVARTIKAGVDGISGRPDGVYAGAAEAYELGLLTEADMDEAIRNVYRTKIKLGLFDEDTWKDGLGDLCSEKARQVCKTLTDKSLVLLKNDGALPLKNEAMQDAVLIGPVGDKWYMDWYGGAAPEHVSLLDGLNKNAAADGQKEIPYFDGCDRISLKCGEKYLAADAEGRYRLSDEPDMFVLEDWGEGSYTLRNEKTGLYILTNLADDIIEGATLAGESVSINDGKAEDEKSITGDGINLAGTGTEPARITGKVCVGKERIFSWFDLEVFRMNGKGKDLREGEIELQDRFGNTLFLDRDGFVVTAREAYGVLTPLCFTMQVIRDGMQEAREAAAKAGTVLLALGHNPMVNAKEEIDRATIAFIPYQQRLFDEMLKVNPNVIVVLMSDYPFAIGELQKKARAILWSATGSQCMGQSLADVLLGKVSPAGRLTQTWYASDEDLPDIDDYDIIGKGRTYQYFAGEALYPFGHGLTYTAFQYGELTLSIMHGNKQVDTQENTQGDAQVNRLDNERTNILDEMSVKNFLRNGKAQKAFGQPNGVYDQIRRDDRVIKVELTVTNTGECTSDEVVQVYVKAPKGNAKRPLKRLIGFERLEEIAPGEARKAELTIPIRELAFYDMGREALVVEGGDYEIMVAPSSQGGGVAQTILIEGETSATLDLSKRIKADHYEETCGSQIVEGLYGFSALMAAGPNAYEPSKDGCFSVSYANCKLPENATSLRIHAIAREDAAIRVFVDDSKVGELTLNTREYETRPSQARNHMPRAVVDEKLRKSSFPLLWADVKIPLDLSGLKDLSLSYGHALRIEVVGPLKFDWFMMR
ncbi:MAG: hypothetical protein E7295_14245 [Lachnospiraceae bacterium]|nr:hypothetical protein [Lachnospiraceae bacterium]